MAYINISNAGTQLYVYDGANPDMVTLNTAAANVKLTVETLTAALTQAQHLAEALGVDLTTSGSTTTTSGSSTPTSGS